MRLVVKCCLRDIFVSLFGVDKVLKVLKISNSYLDSFIICNASVLFTSNYIVMKVVLLESKLHHNLFMVVIHYLIFLCFL